VRSPSPLMALTSSLGRKTGGNGGARGGGSVGEHGGLYCLCGVGDSRGTEDSRVHVVRAKPCWAVATGQGVMAAVCAAAARGQHST